MIYKTFLFLWLSSASLLSFSQFQSGYNVAECSDALALCNNFTFFAVFEDESLITPKGYEKAYESGIKGLDNQFQVWKNDKYAFVVFRGSTTDKLSWLSNMYSAMIPSKGEIELPGKEKIKYNIANNKNAHIHAGWTLATTFLVKDVIQQIKLLNYEGIHHIILTGHSQGSAIAQLIRLNLENQPKGTFKDQNYFKTYAFASPKIGNEALVNEVAQRFGNSTFLIQNPSDPITQMPINIDNKNMFSMQEVAEHMLDTNKSYFKTLAYRAVSKMLFDNPDSAYINFSGDNILKQINSELGTIKMPSYVVDIKYTVYPAQQTIGPFVYETFEHWPYIDAMKITDDEGFSQHKPYLYLLYYLKTYNEKAYKNFIRSAKRL
ncbi:MAG: hypothetical protein JXR60_10900 [Bacteroidales bacterium]|nr:hypothetical protein [Bacteroidales bacterium]